MDPVFVKFVDALAFQFNVPRALWFNISLFVFKMDPILLQMYVYTFTAEGINGKALYSIEKSDLKDLGINTLGRRLEIYEEIKLLTSKEEEKASAKSEGQ